MNKIFFDSFLNRIIDTKFVDKTIIVAAHSLSETKFSGLDDGSPVQYVKAQVGHRKIFDYRFGT